MKTIRNISIIIISMLIIPAFFIGMKEIFTENNWFEPLFYITCIVFIFSWGATSPK